MCPYVNVASAAPSSTVLPVSLLSSALKYSYKENFIHADCTLLLLQPKINDFSIRIRMLSITNE